MDDSRPDELTAGAEDAVVWESGVLDTLEFVVVEESRVDMFGIIEGSLVVQLDGKVVFVVKNAVDHDLQTFEANVPSVDHDPRLCF